MNDKLWQKFLKWLYKTHSLTRDWTPSRISIELWEEYNEAEQSQKTGKTSAKGSKNTKK